MHPHSSYLPLSEILKSKNEIIIGRDSSCDLVLSDPYVSRRHCRIFKENQRYFVEDLNSTNGTFINNIRLRKIQELKENDELILGFQVLYLNSEGVNTSDALAIETQNLSVTVSGKVILHPVSAQVPKGSFLAIMGPSGSGKSTIIKAITGFMPFQGNVKIFGLDTRKYEQYIFSKIGYVGQVDYLPNDLSVKEVMYYAFHLKKSILPHNVDKESIIRQTLQKVNLFSQEHLTKKVKELSGGEKKRLSIAVEMLSQPALLILDEPTSPLDPETIREFLSYLKSIQKEGTTIVMVTHKTEDIPYADLLWFVGKGGKICYIGHPDNLLNTFDKKNYFEIYELLSNNKNADAYALQFRENTTNKSHPDKASLGHSSKKTLFYFKQQVISTYWLTLRYATIKQKQGLNFLAMIVLQPIIIALLIYSIFNQFQISNLFMLSIAAIWFGISNSAREIVDEWALFVKEKKYGINPISYYSSKFLILNLITFIQVFLITTTCYFLYKNADIHIFGFTTYLSNLQLTAMSAISLGLLISSLFTEAVKVISIIPLVLIPQILFSGVISPLDSPVKELISTMVISRWSTELLCRTQDQYTPATKELTLLFNSEKDTVFKEIKPCEPLLHCPGNKEIIIKIPENIHIRYQSKKKVEKAAVYQQTPEWCSDTLIVTPSRDTIPLLSNNHKYEKVSALSQLNSYKQNSILSFMNNYKNNLFVLLLQTLIYILLTLYRLFTVKIII